MKTRGSTPGLHWKLSDLSTGGVSGIPGVAVKCVDIRRNTGGEGGLLDSKAAYWTVTDVEARKRGEQTGLDTLVVHAVNDEGRRCRRKRIKYSTWGVRTQV